MNVTSPIRFVFFGSSRFSVIVLDELEKLGLIPTCVVTTPDKPRGRGLLLQATPVKEWALARKISICDPATLDADLIEKLKKEGCDVFIVASFGKIIPEAIFNLPSRKTLNIHPSLLPKYRGASPLQSAILNDDKKTGVSIMRIGAKMDEGPIVRQKEISIDEWPVYEDLEEQVAKEGARLLASILPEWVAGKIVERPQDHSQATYTKKISKEDALLDLNGDARLNFLKIQAFHEWPTAHFMAERKKEGRKEGTMQLARVKVTSASFKDGRLMIEKVIPEGSRKMTYADFLRGYGDPLIAR